MKAFPLLLLVLLVFVSHCVYAQLVENEDSKRARFAMSGKFKLLNESTGLQTGEGNEDNEALHHCQSSLETAIQNATLTHEKLERMVEEFNTELDNLERNLTKKTKQAQSSEDRARETRRKLTEAESELRYMHTQAMSTYVNVTLMQEDVANSVRKRITGTLRYVENHYRRRLSPRIRRAKQSYHAELRRQQPNIKSLKRKITSLIKKAENRWTKSALRPLVQRTTKAVSKKLYARMEPSLKVAQEAAYLSAVSAIEEISRAGINYLDELAEKQKERERRDQERQLGRRRRATKDRRDKPVGRKDRKKGDEDDFDFIPSVLQRKVKGALEHALRHSKWIANRRPYHFDLAHLSCQVGAPRQTILSIALKKRVKYDIITRCA
eukprot:scaffold1669_cov99-Skeletonema_dohrnii-CCMP3373.AAC.17